MFGGKLKLKNQKNFTTVSNKRKADKDSDYLEEQIKKELKQYQEEQKQLLQKESEVEENGKSEFTLMINDVEYIEQPVQKGLGKIITSDRTVHGFETNFPSQLELGDFIIIENDEGIQERRKINMVLSAKSCGIDEAFSKDIMTKKDYLFQKKPKLREKAKPVEEIVAERLKNDSKRQKTEDDNEDKEVEIRVKKGTWGYKTVKEKVKGDASKEQLLDMRVKKKTDKFCWF